MQPMNELLNLAIIVQCCYSGFLPHQCLHSVLNSPKAAKRARMAKRHDFEQMDSSEKVVHVERLALDCCEDAVLLSTGKISPKISFCNLAFVRLFASEQAILQNLPVGDIPFVKDPSSLVSIIAAALTSKTKTEVEFGVKTNNWRYKATCTPLSDDTCCIIFKQVLCRNECLEILDENTPLLVQIFEQDRDSGDILYHFVSHKGLTYQVDNHPPGPSPVGKTLSETGAYLPKGEREWWMNNIRSVNKVGATARFEREIPLPGREETKVLLGVLVKNVGLTSEGNFKFFVVIDDLTSMKKLQIELAKTGENLEHSREQASLYKMLVEHTPIPIGLVRPMDGDSDVECLFANVATARLYGYDETTIKSLKRFSDLGLPKEALSFWCTKYREAERQGHAIEFETEDPLKSIWWHNWLCHISEDRFAFVCSDITLRVQYERKLQENQARLEREMEARTKQLEDAMQVKSRFLAVMSHEIRTPLSGIIGSMSLLSDQRLTAEQRDVVNLALLCGEQLLVVINDILDHSRLEENKVHLERSAFSLPETIEEAIEIISLAAYKKGLELICDIADDTQDQIIGDQARIRQILVNLLSNAAKFTPQGEISVRVSSKQQRREGESEDECLVEISVGDTGIGIEPQVLENLFQPFVQGDSSMSRKFGGSGLGLHICKRLVELMGGEISVRSTVGAGSTFTFTIRSPVIVTITSSTSRSPTASHHLITSPSSSLLPIVIIEKNQSLRNLLLRKCLAWGYRCVGFESLQEAAGHLLQLTGYGNASDSRKRKGDGGVERINSRESELFAVLLISTIALMECEASVSTHRDLLHLVHDHTKLLLMGHAQLNPITLHGHQSPNSAEHPLLRDDLPNLRREHRDVSSLVPHSKSTEEKNGNGAPAEITVDHLLAVATFVRKPIRDRVLKEELARGTMHKNRRLMNGSSDLVPHTFSTEAPNVSRILIAEDNSANQVIIKKLLESLGFKNVDVVSNGREAINAVKERQYHVVLMDVMMPEVTGIEATQAIRRDLPLTKQPKIIAITANAFQEDRNKCISAGMDGVITKPIRKKELAAVLQKAIYLQLQENQKS